MHNQPRFFLHRLSKQVSGDAALKEMFHSCVGRYFAGAVREIYQASPLAEAECFWAEVDRQSICGLFLPAVTAFNQTKQWKTQWQNYEASVKNPVHIFIFVAFIELSVEDAMKEEASLAEAAKENRNPGYFRLMQYYSATNGTEDYMAVREVANFKIVEKQNVLMRPAGPKNKIYNFFEAAKVNDNELADFLELGMDVRSLKCPESEP